jgi:hypothetical protein
MASPECTARWERLLPPTSPEAAVTLRPGPIAEAISGSFLGGATMSTAITALSTTCGSSILPQLRQRLRANGHGWAEAAQLASPECTARWERLLPETFPETVLALRVRPTAAAISGSSGAMALMPTEMAAFSTIFGSSIDRSAPTENGRGWVEAARCRRRAVTMAASPECTARWERLLPDQHPRRPRRTCELDRQQRQSLALWGRWLRCQRGLWLAQRPLGVQSFYERMGMDGWKQHDSQLRF